MKREDSFQAWAGNLKPEGRQMTHYDLLGLPLFESDTKLIREMVQKQLRAVWNYTNGPNAHQARKLRNKIDQSARCLLNARLKSEYDRRLREQLGEEEPEPADDDQPMVVVDTSGPQATDVVARRQMKAEQESNRLIIIGSIAVFIAIVLGLVFAFLPGGEEEPKPGTKIEEPEAPLPKQTPDAPAPKKTPQADTDKSK